MHLLPNSNRSFGNGSSSGQIRMSQSFATNDNSYKELILKANSVPLPIILAQYNIHLDDGKKIRCPFGSKHKDGVDKSPSFNYWSDTNTFYCFGCQTSGGCVNFVCEQEKIGFLKAAKKILDQYSQNIDENYDHISDSDWNEKLIILMDFSSRIRDSMKNYPHKVDKIEKLTQVFDNMLEKHSMSLDGTKRIIEIIDGRLELCLK